MNPALTTLIGQALKLSRHSPRTDGELLRRFVAWRDESAFEDLLHRFGPMVLGICRRLLRDPNDVEDAFQAVFLVLVRKADSIQTPELIGNWLYGVAHRIAVRARRQNTAHSQRQSMLPVEAVMSLRDSPADSALWQELQPILDEEILRLPTKYRVPFILCHLEGKTYDQIARELGWKPGTVSGRLARARERLRFRLSRRGCTLTSISCAALLSETALAAAVPTPLITATLKCLAWPTAVSKGLIPLAAVALADGALKTMALAKLKFAALVLFSIGLLGTGAGIATRQVLAANQAQVDQAEKPKNDEPKAEKPLPEKRKPAVDLYGDPLPEGAIARYGTLRFRHGAGIGFLVFSPDGNTIASSSADDTVRLWEVATGKEKKRLSVDPASGQNSLAIQDGGKRIVSVNIKRFQHWDAATGKELAKHGIKSEGTRPSYCAGLSRDGTMAAISFPENQTKTTIEIIDSATGKKKGAFESDAAITQTIAFSNSGKLLALSSRMDNIVRLHEVETGKSVARFEGQPYKDWVQHAISFSPNDKWMAVSEQDHSIQLWDVEEKKKMRGLSGHSLAVLASAFSPDGNRLASASTDGTIRVWDVTTGQQLLNIMSGMRSYAISYSPDGTLLAAGGAEAAIRIFDSTSGKEQSLVKNQLSGIGEVQWLSDGKTVLCGNRNSVCTWEAMTGKETFRLSTVGIVGSFRASPDGASIAKSNDKGAIQIIDRITGQEVRHLVGHEHLAWALTFSPDGSSLYSSGADKSVRQWQVPSGKETRQFKGHEGYVTRIVASPNGRWIATSATDAGTRDLVRIWDVATGKELRQITLYPKAAFQTAFSPDSKRIVTVGGLPGRRNVSGDVQLWDVATGNEVRNFIGHKERVLAAAYAPDGRSLATASIDNTFRLWEVASGKERMQIVGHQGNVESLDYSPDGRFLVSSSTDSTALVWDLSGRAQRNNSAAANPSSKDLESHWAALVDVDAMKAFQSMRKLMVSDKQAIPYLKSRLKSAHTSFDVKAINRFVANLDSPTFSVREKATKELQALAELAESPIRKALENPPSPESKRRLETLLSELGKPLVSGEKLRTLRAIEVLEHIGSPDAQVVLKTLADGAPSALETIEAKASLHRLAKRPR